MKNKNDPKNWTCKCGAKNLSARGGYVCPECKPTHTPTPWIQDGNLVFKLGNNRNIFSCSVQAQPRNEELEKSNAAFIVKAVNCHEDILEALKGLLNEYLRAREFINEKCAGQVSQEDAKDAVRIKRAIRELIAAAEGGK